MNCYKFVYSQTSCIIGYRFERTYLSSKILYNDISYYSNYTVLITQRHQAENTYKIYYGSKTTL